VSNDPRITVAQPPARPLLLFDGDCGFCRRWILRWRQLTGTRVDYQPAQEGGSRFPEIPEERFRREVVLIEPDGRVSGGAEAVLRTRALAPGHRGLWWLYRKLRPFRWLAERAYRVIASHRNSASFLTRLLWGRSTALPTYRLSTWLFLRLLAFSGLAAFGSLAWQLRGLIGSQGILPAQGFLEAIEPTLGSTRWWRLPTIFWLGASDRAMVGACVAGLLFSLLLLLDLAPAFSLLGIWITYLSLANVSGVFLGYQWDSLLIETCLLALFLAPLSLNPGARPLPEVPKWPRRLLLFLLFRLMFSSGWVKLASGDPTWRHLTALDFHFQTQPLPTWVAWYFQLLPGSLHRWMTGGVLAIELLVPFLILGPRRLRQVAFALFVLLQLLITATGNYAFFNLLTLALCLLLIDDDGWPESIRRWFSRAPISRPRPLRFAPKPLTSGFMILLGLLASVQVATTCFPSLAANTPARDILATSASFRSVNPYGLFAVMTTRRHEISIEGSVDGAHWKRYRFRYKPGALDRRPRFIAPYQPRLDWQMWFAALGSCRQNHWFLAFAERLLSGDRAVTRLLANDPFPDQRPRFLRTTVRDYTFTDWTTRRKTGDWWQARRLGPYCPELSLSPAAAER